MVLMTTMMVMNGGNDDDNYEDNILYLTLQVRQSYQHLADDGGETGGGQGSSQCDSRTEYLVTY